VPTRASVVIQKGRLGAIQAQDVLVTMDATKIGVDAPDHARGESERRCNKISVLESGIFRAKAIANRID